MSAIVKKVVIIGAGGLGRETLSVFEACNSVERAFDVLGYIVQKEYSAAGVVINGIPVLGDFDWLEQHHRQVYVSCGVGPSHHRRRLVAIAEKIGCRFVGAVHPTVCHTRWSSIGEGSVIAAGCVITSQVTIGRHVQVNPACTISHDAMLGDFVTLAPGVHVCGNVTVHEGCSIGVGANVIQRCSLGAWSVIGAGSTIIRDVPPNTTTVGVPGKVIQTRSEGWHLA